MKDEAEQKAEEVCKQALEGLTDHPIFWKTKAQFVAAVAAALREAQEWLPLYEEYERLTKAEIAGLKLSEIEQLKAERDAVKAEMQSHIDDVNRLLAERDAAYKASLELEKESLTAFVRGLYRAKEIAHKDSSVDSATIEYSIDAEINKVKAKVKP